MSLSECVVLMIDILTEMRWTLKAIFIFISLMAKGVKYFLKYVLTVCTSSVENCLYSLVNLLIDWAFWCLVL